MGRSGVTPPSPPSPSPGGRGYSLEGSAAALMSSGLLTSALGFAFWVLAARTVEVAEVGRASALITSATMLAALAALGIGPLYERFLSVAGPRARRLAWAGHGVALGLSVLLGTGFAVLAPSGRLLGSTWAMVAFPLCVAALAAFALQDPILIGLGRAPQVAVKNVVQSALKLGCLALVVPLAASGSVIVAVWVVPAAVIALLVAWRVVPRGLAELGPGDGLPSARSLWAYFGNSYIMMSLGMAVPMLVPLLVVGQVGTVANAYFAICWLMIVAAELVVTAPSGPFVAAWGTADPARRWQLTVRMLRMSLGLGVLGALALLVAAPWLLAVFGPQYAAEGTRLLRILALTLPLVALMTGYGALARADGRLRFATLAQTVNGIGVIVGLLVALPAWGVAGAGYAFLGADLVTVVLVAVPATLLLRSTRRAAHSVPAEPSTRPLEDHA